MILIKLASSTFLLIFRKRWGYIFNNDEEVIALVGGIMPLVALFQVYYPACVVKQV
jgi:MATE family multidrug resistance protein